MRRTPLPLAIAIAGGIMLALSGSVLAANGHGAGSQSSLHSQSAVHSQSSSGQHSSNATTSGRSNSNASGGSTERDVPGASVDPSAKSAHDHDNGIGNDCDPGYGGSPNDNGNDGGHGTSSFSETEVSGCGTTQGGHGGGPGGCTSDCGPGQTPPPNTCSTDTDDCTPPTGTPVCSSTDTDDCAGGITTGHGGGSEGVTTNVSGLTTAAGGLGGGVAAAAGVGLANTGLKTIGLGLLALILIALGVVLMVRRPSRARA